MQGVTSAMESWIIMKSWEFSKTSSNNPWHSWQFAVWSCRIWLPACEFAASALRDAKTNGQPRGSSTPTPVVLPVCNGQSAWLERMEDSGGSEHLENLNVRKMEENSGVSILLFLVYRFLTKGHPKVNIVITSCGWNSRIWKDITKSTSNTRN